MWLKQFQAFQISFDFEKDLAPRLAEHGLTPCPAHTRMTHGWKMLPNQQLSQSIHGYSVCLFGKEERILPSSVVQNLVEKKTQELDQARGYPMKRHEKQQLKQDIEFDLLPKAFCVQKKQAILFDAKRNRMLVEATSPQQIETILAFIHKTVANSVDISPLIPKEDVVLQWQQWLAKPEALPHYLQLADRIQWIDSDNQRKQIRCQGYDWQEDSAEDWLNKGLVPHEVSFIWRDLLQFTLNSKFNFKRVQPLPSLQEELDANSIDHQDEQSNLLLIGHTYQQLLDDLSDLTGIGKATQVELEIAGA